MAKTTYVKTTRPVTHLGNMASMKIPAKVLNQIRFLHEKVGAVEWSGILMMKMNGSLNNIDEMEVDIEGIFPCNIGSAHGTEYFMADHMDAAFEQYPAYDFMEGGRWDGIESTVGTKIGQIHTHHSLSGGAYFSGVDMGDLDENVGAHGLYISLIVAMDGEFVCKGSFIATSTISSSLQAKDYATNLEFEPETVEHLVTFDFDIEIEEPVDDWMIDQLVELEDSKLAQQEAVNNIKTLATIANWTKYRNKDAAEFVPLVGHQKTLETAGFGHFYYIGYGNVYTDTMGVAWSDGGLEIDDHELANIKADHAEFAPFVETEEG